MKKSKIANKRMSEKQRKRERKLNKDEMVVSCEMTI